MKSITKNNQKRRHSVLNLGPAACVSSNSSPQSIATFGAVCLHCTIHHSVTNYGPTKGGIRHLRSSGLFRRE